MRNISSIIISLFLCLPVFVYAGGIVTDDQKSNFSSIMHVDANEFEVPTVIDVPIVFNPKMVGQHVVVASSGEAVPSVLVTQTSEQNIKLQVGESPQIENESYMTDNNSSTYADFEYVETYDEEGVVQDNTVVIDIHGDRAFSADSFSISLDEHVARPTYVRVMYVLPGGEEKILLAEQRMMSNYVVFPTGVSDHFRIEFTYTKPLRINEITFYEENVPYAIEKFVRFIAQPAATYDIYYNGARSVKIDLGEMPNLYSTKDREIVQGNTPISNVTYKKMDSDEDGVTDDIDNCVNVQNEDQEDKNANNIGDACEDFDRDGVINSKDNCPDDTNRNQRDEDLDGIGDACDEEESRFTEKYVWFPWAAMGFAAAVVGGLFVMTFRGMKKEREEVVTESVPEQMPPSEPHTPEEQVENTNTTSQM